MKRKDFLTLSAATLVISASSPHSLLGNEIQYKKPFLRIAHLTDVHIHPKGPSEVGFTKALHKVQSLEPQPDMIFNGGDSIMDSLNASKEETTSQWKLWNDVLKRENNLPVINCIGNHDVWGWGLKGDKNLTGDKDFGKQMAMEAFDLIDKYYSFDKQGWHFIVLDSTHYSQFKYEAKLDEEQFEWLKNDLQSVSSNVPIAVLSHIPILSFSSQFFSGENRKKPSTMEWAQRSLMHTDAFEIKNLFREFKNVKLCMAGHLHMQEQLEYLGIKYIENGSVCGNWWKGNFQEFSPAFAIIDFYPDGTFYNQWINY
jgi:3',5'-cyclic AMP phosphodiesterase CpdA